MRLETMSPECETLLAAVIYALCDMRGSTTRRPGDIIGELVVALLEMGR